MTSWTTVTTMGDLLLRSAERRPEHEALVFPDARYDYAETARRALDAARSLAALGVRAGDRVGLLMPNCPDFVFAFFGIQLLGAVAVPLNTRYRARELAYVIENADLVALLTTDLADEQVNYVERLVETFPELAAADAERLELAAAPLLRTLVLVGESTPPGFLSRGRFEELAAEVDAEEIVERRARVRLRDVCMIMFTSGTTANPKGCLLTHEAVVRVWTSVAETLRITEDDRIWDALPMFHMSFLGPLTFGFGLGATLISMPHFEPAAALRQIESEGATWLYSVFPPIVMGLIRHPEFAERDLSKVRGLLNVAPPETLQLIQDAFAPAIQVGGHFGMSECAGAITCNEWEASLADRVGTCGPALPGISVRVVDPESGEPLGPGERGELQIRGYGALEAYHKDPEHTAELFAPGGWLRSGDQGTMDERGYVVYLGRLKDMLKIGGENAAPSEIEAHISTHPAVKLVQVVGAPDERLEEVAAAFVELVPGADLDEATLISYCQGQIASFKVPRHVRFIDGSEWPMSATKIQKFRLQERIKAELNPTPR